MAAIEPTDSDIGKRVKYLDGALGTLTKFTEFYAYVTYDVRKRVNKEWIMAPGEVASPTDFAELEWA